MLSCCAVPTDVHYYGVQMLSDAAESHAFCYTPHRPAISPYCAAGLPARYNRAAQRGQGGHSTTAPCSNPLTRWKYTQREFICWVSPSCTTKLRPLPDRYWIADGRLVRLVICNQTSHAFFCGSPSEKQPVTRLTR